MLTMGEVNIVGKVIGQCELLKQYTLFMVGLYGEKKVVPSMVDVGFGVGGVRSSIVGSCSGKCTVVAAVAMDVGAATRLAMGAVAGTLVGVAKGVSTRVSVGEALAAMGRSSTKRWCRNCSRSISPLLQRFSEFF